MSHRRSSLTRSRHIPHVSLVHTDLVQMCATLFYQRQQSCRDFSAHFGIKIYVFYKTNSSRCQSQDCLSVSQHTSSNSPVRLCACFYHCQITRNIPRSIRHAELAERERECVSVSSTRGFQLRHPLLIYSI